MEYTLSKVQRELLRDEIIKNKIIVIVRGVEKEKLIPLANAMYNGGIRLIEVTYSANGEVSDNETASCIEMLAKEFEGKMIIGAGTVLNEKQVELTKNAGGKFIISPDTNKDVITKTISMGMVSITGALTPTEIQTAYRYGADFVKLFPVTSMGSSYVKAVKAPLSHIKLLAVGGIDENNMESYMKAGINGFGIGSNIVDKMMIATNNYTGIEELARKYVKAVEK